MNDIWVFTENNARLLRSDERLDTSRLKTYVVNPDLSSVIGIAPHYWKLVAGKIVPMTTDECQKRDTHIAENGTDNQPYRIPDVKPETVIAISQPSRPPDLDLLIYWFLLACNVALSGYGLMKLLGFK